ncbi:MAG: ImmA/IrrE family metallo-endopeptidase [Gammaproteobacteria bacterium]|nr:ImmA/IrrE family metallo-endopeptidase [Gammaproteobacteria bacterium]
MMDDLFDGQDEKPQAKQASEASVDEEQARSLLDGLLEESRLYTRSKDYREMLKFTVKLRNFAPFNAMLLHIQKPGLTYAASARDWQERFNRYPKRDARPLLILWPFGPVALVYDVQDTEGEPLPESAQMFPARGEMSKQRMYEFAKKLWKRGIEWAAFDGGDAKAGYVDDFPKKDRKAKRRYLLSINQNHSPVTQFVTLAHELGHLCLGHCGRDKDLNIPDRKGVSHTQREIEAESVAYIVCHRQGIEPKSQSYLSNFVKPKRGEHEEMAGMDFYQVMRAAGQVETFLGLVNHTQFTRAKKAPRG